ncbi:MAG TPA: elongation factor G [bacterium]|nr:elongation factor G [bacterium]HQG44491.1 elongation factor G [bacterium]HQI48012.1 elongation factor G [bacterium]HQJ64982.1 elongation factor G [bacterium]
MKDYGPNDIRNVGLVSHQSTGKTTLVEGMLFAAGAVTRLGTIDDGTTTSDYRQDEIDRKISISAALMTIDWKKCKFNLLDLPGYPDFIGEVYCGIRVTDLAVVLLNGVSGIEVGTDMAWEVLEKNKSPRLFFVNRLDKEHADFSKVVAETQEAYGFSVIPVQFPASEGEGFDAVIDLLTMKKLTFQTDGSGKYKIEEIPADLKGRADEMRNALIEKIAEADDAILEKYFDAGELTAEEITRGLRAGIRNASIYPVLCGAANRNIGSIPLLDFIADYGPAPSDRPAVAAVDAGGTAVEVATDVKAPFSGLIFKTLSEMHVGELSLIRVYSGQIKSGDEVLNTSNNVTEKIGQIYELNGRNRKEMGTLIAGDIAALVKLRNTHTNNTLADRKKPVVFPAVIFPEPVVQVAVTPKSKGDEDKISSGLHTLNETDPSFTIEINPELKQTVLSGQGEIHLAVIVNRLKERYGVEVEQKKPRIPYRETITGKADEKYRHKKQTGGAGQFAEVWMRIEPLPRGAGFEFESQIVGGSISGPFIPSIEKGVRQILEEGAIAGYRIVDVKAIVYDGKEHPVDSKDIAFQIAGREVFKMCVQSAKPILLEPIYDIEVKCPEENMGDIMGDLNSRRGRIMGMESIGRFQVVKAKIPLAELHNYSSTLRSLTQGRASYTRKFSHYDPMPKEVEAKVIAEAQAEKAAAH